MAQLNPKDPQFGIPVATRIRKELAVRFNEEAVKKSKTLSRYVAEFIEKAVFNEKKIIELTGQLTKEKETVAAKEKRGKELEAQLLRERELVQKTAGRFILEITKGHQKQTTQYIQTYNTILKDEKSK